MRQPQLGDRVYAHTSETTNNGSLVCSASITRVWGQRDDGSWTVNIRLTKDAPPAADEWKTSVLLFATHDEAIEHGPSSCWWPPTAPEPADTEIAAAEVEDDEQ